MKRTLFFIAMLAWIAFACNEQDGSPVLDIDDTISGGLGDFPNEIMTLDELLNANGTFRLYGPENRVYVIKDGAMSYKQEDYDAATDIEVIYPDDLTDIITLGDGKDYVLEEGIWHEILEPCGPNIHMITRETVPEPCNIAGDYKCCEVTTMWLCVPNLVKVSTTKVCEPDCRPANPIHPHYPCGYHP